MRVAGEESRRRVSSEHPSWALNIIWLHEAAPNAAGGSCQAGVTLPGDCLSPRRLHGKGPAGGTGPPAPLCAGCRVSNGARKGSVCVCVHVRTRVCVCVRVHVRVHDRSIHLGLQQTHSTASEPGKARFGLFQLRGNTWAF